MKEYAIYDRYMYPGPEPRTPINKFGIRDRRAFEAHEARIVAIRARNIPDKARQLNYRGLRGFKALHKHLFQDVFEWAGKERTYTTGRNAVAAFARPEHIVPFVEKEFAKFEAQGRFAGPSRPFTNGLFQFGGRMLEVDK